MDEQRGTPKWLPWSAAALLSLAVGVTAYNFGLQQGAGAATESVRHWHFGVPWFAFLAVFWFALLLRRCYWGPPRYRAWYDDPGRWDEWHRRAHEHNTPDHRPMP